jgi:hypothetical protein
MLDAALDLIGKSGRLGSVALNGLSMHPTFAGVERLAVEFSPQRVSFGDVLVFRQRGLLVVHRLVQRQRRGDAVRLRTRGDGTIGFDPWVDPASVIGRVVAVGFAGDVWRNLRNTRARLYGRMVAAHDFCWGGFGALLLKFGGTGGQDWHWRLGRLDRFKLRLAHMLFFRAAHPLIPAPEFDGSRDDRDSVDAGAHCYTSRLGHAPRRKTPPNQ